MSSSTKKKTKKSTHDDLLSSSGVSSLSGISSYNIRKITIFKNGDRFHHGVKFVINPRIVKDIDPLLNQINDKIELPNGVKRIYTADGKIIRNIKDLEDGKIYVAASAHFIPMGYGKFEEKVWKPPSRKHSPIFSSLLSNSLSNSASFRDDRIKTARTRSQEPRQKQAARELSVRKSQNNLNTLNRSSTVTRSRSVRTLVDDRKSRKDDINGAKKVLEVRRQTPKKVVQKAAPHSTSPAKKPAATPAVIKKASIVAPPSKRPPSTKKPKTPKPKTPKPKTPQPAMTAASVTSESSVIPAPNIESGAAEILEFREAAKVVNVETIHKTPTPPERKASTHSEAHSEEEEGHSAESNGDSESEEASEKDDDDDETASDDEGEDEEDEEDESEGSGDEKSEGSGSEVGTPSSRKSSSSAVSSSASNPPATSATSGEKPKTAEKKT